MGNLTLTALRVVLALVLAGTLFVQAVMVPVIWSDMDGADADVLAIRVPFVVILVLGIATVQVCAVCVWRLLTLVRRGTVFSDASFRYVDVVIGAITVAALLAFALGVVLAPGEAAAPGVVLLIGGIGLTILGIALIVLVLRMLLAQAVARDAEASSLRAELDEVI
jgi:hypothetical protein